MYLQILFDLQSVGKRRSKVQDLARSNHGYAENKYKMQISAHLYASQTSKLWRSDAWYENEVGYFQFFSNNFKGISK